MNTMIIFIIHILPLFTIILVRNDIFLSFLVHYFGGESPHFNVSHFKKVAEERTLEKKAARMTSVPIDLDAEMDINEDNLKNIGYLVWN